MVHDKIHADVDAFFVAGFGQILQILHGAKLFLHLAEIRHRIAAVRTALHRVQKRHQMNIIHITFLNIIQLRLHALHIAGKIINIEHHAQHVVGLIPARMLLPLRVLLLQIQVAFLIEAVEIVAQLRKHRTVVIKLHVKPFQLIKMTAEPAAVAGLLIHRKLPHLRCLLLFSDCRRFILRSVSRFLLTHIPNLITYKIPGG